MEPASPRRQTSGQRVVVTGASGLVGQNLIPRLKARGFDNIVAIDKHVTNNAILRSLHPDVAVIEADLAKDDTWQEALEGAAVLVSAHAQIGGIDPQAFIDNNVDRDKAAACRSKQGERSLPRSDQFFGGEFRRGRLLYRE